MVLAWFPSIELYVEYDDYGGTTIYTDAFVAGITTDGGGAFPSYWRGVLDSNEDPDPSTFERNGDALRWTWQGSPDGVHTTVEGSFDGAEIVVEHEGSGDAAHAGLLHGVGYSPEAKEGGLGRREVLGRGLHLFVH